MQKDKIIRWKDYRKPGTQTMAEWFPGFPMKGVSISKEDKANGSPKIGDMIAVNNMNGDDRWLVAKDFFRDNYVLVKN